MDGPVKSADSETKQRWKCARKLHVHLNYEKMAEKKDKKTTLLYMYMGKSLYKTSFQLRMALIKGPKQGRDERT